MNVYVSLPEDSTIHCSQTLGTTQMPKTLEWINNLWYIYIMDTVSSGDEQPTIICNNMYECYKQVCAGSHTQKECMLYDSIQKQTKLTCAVWR